MTSCDSEQYGAICDVVERTYHGWPIDHDEENPWSHTSKEARAATNRILEILKVEVEMPDFTPAELKAMASFVQRSERAES